MPVSGVIFLCTDDFVAGAELMGVDPDEARRRVAVTAAAADAVLAVSPTLAATLGGPSTRVRVFPNGCTPRPTRGPRPDERGHGAVLVGQLNDRLDVEAVLAVADRGIPLTVVGPRCEREERSRGLIDRLLDHPEVQWLGRVPAAEVEAHLAGAAVGLTPYRDTEFNRASFPLKTLEYLASGVPVVSTELPASRWLDSPVVDVATSVEEFADLAERRARTGRDASVDAACRSLAGRHSWAARADELAEMVIALGSPPPTHRSPSPGVSRAR